MANQKKMKKLFIDTLSTISGVLLSNRYTIAEKYFYIVLCYLSEQREGGQGFFVGHDLIFQNGTPPLRAFGLSRRICISARRRLKDGGLISSRHIYSIKGHRVGTEYRIANTNNQGRIKAIHAQIFDKSYPLR